MGDDQHLGAGGEALEAQAHRVGDGAADALVDLVEDHQRLGSGAAPASAAFRASAKRASSPPEAIAPSAPNGAPGLVAISNSTRSAPDGPARSSASGLDGDAEAGLVQLQGRELGLDGGGQAIAGGAAGRAKGRRQPRGRRPATGVRRGLGGRQRASSRVSPGPAGGRRPRPGQRAGRQAPRQACGPWRAGRTSRSSALLQALGIEIEGALPRRRSPPTPRSPRPARGPELRRRRRCAPRLCSSVLPRPLAGAIPRPLQRAQRLAETPARGPRHPARRARWRMSASVFSAAPSKARSSASVACLAASRIEPVELGQPARRVLPPPPAERSRASRRSLAVPRRRPPGAPGLEARPPQTLAAAERDRAGPRGCADRADRPSRAGHAPRPAARPDRAARRRPTGWSLTKARERPSAASVRRRTRSSSRAYASPFSSRYAQTAASGAGAKMAVTLACDAPRRTSEASARAPVARPKRVQDDRLASARLTGERGQSRPRRQVQALDQHHVADGKADQHGRHNGRDSGAVQTSAEPCRLRRNARPDKEGSPRALERDDRRNGMRFGPARSKAQERRE